MSNGCYRIVAVWLAATLMGGPALAEETNPGDRPVNDSSPGLARSKILVRDLSQLTTVTQQDYVVSSRVDSMNARKKFALVTGSLGVSAGLGAVVTSLILASGKNCNSLSASYQACVDDHASRFRTSRTLLAVGGSVLVGTLLLALVVYPSSREIRDTVRQYNQRNPDEKVTVAPTFEGL